MHGSTLTWLMGEQLGRLQRSLGNREWRESRRQPGFPERARGTSGMEKFRKYLASKLGQLENELTAAPVVICVFMYV